MVQKVTGFKTQDGKVFNTEAEAVSHEKVLLLGVAVGAALAALGFEGAVVVKDGSDDVVDLKTFLLNNSEVIIDALTPPKKERKPRTPKEPVANAAPVVTEKAPAEEVVTEKVKLEVLGSTINAEEELAVLLGGEVQV